LIRYGRLAAPPIARSGSAAQSGKLDQQSIPIWKLGTVFGNLEHVDGDAKARALVGKS
jgi:hypothetical protein